LLAVLTAACDAPTLPTPAEPEEPGTEQPVDPEEPGAEDPGAEEPADPEEPGTEQPADPEAPAEPSQAADLDNPYVGAQVYVNPIWSANAASEPGGAAIADQPTAVWMDRIGAIEGNDSPTTGSMGLRDHLDEAVAQGADLIQVVIYNLPGRDCAALASNGELGPDELDRYESEYIDPIADILDDPAYSDLRIVTIIEIDSLPNLITNVGSRNTATANCDEMLANGNYVNGVGYALGTLGAIPNVYNYIDIGHHGWLGWDDNFEPFAQLALEAANANGATPDDVHGFASNVANYGATIEPYFDIGDTVNGVPIREQSTWIDWNRYVDELSYAQAYRDLLASIGFDDNLGMLIDTSRNGWGGPDRPTGPGPTTSADAYVDGGRIDRRIHLGNWCNQAGAGLGERPTAAPEPGIDAYVWIKPPGESDGSSEFIPNDEGKGFDEMCDPDYQGNPRNVNNPSGALPNAPISGHWFSAQFQELLQNAYPPVQ
jgi:cellulose 1,4-beta-cellobiosidase